MYNSLSAGAVDVADDSGSVYSIRHQKGQDLAINMDGKQSVACLWCKGGKHEKVDHWIAKASLKWLMERSEIIRNGQVKAQSHPKCAVPKPTPAGQATPKNQIYHSKWLIFCTICLQMIRVNLPESIWTRSVPKKDQDLPSRLTITGFDAAVSDVQSGRLARNDHWGWQ